MGANSHFASNMKMHDAIMLGVGFLDKDARKKVFDPKIEYPVYISEPLVVLDLSSQFQKFNQTMRKDWIANTFSTARNRSSLGYVFEEAVLLVLVETFGTNATELAKVFHCDSSLGSRKATLVSLKRTVRGDLQTCPVSWTAGSSDRFGFKAQSPKDAFTFLDNPNGKAFLFPDILTCCASSKTKKQRS